MPHLVFGIVIVKYQLEIWMLGWTVSLFTPTPILTFIWVTSSFVSVPIFLVWPWTRSWSLLVVMVVSPLWMLLSPPRTTRRRGIWSRPLIPRPSMRRHSNPAQISSRRCFSWSVPLTHLNLYLPPIDAKTIEFISGFGWVILKLELGKAVPPWHFDFLRIILRRSERFVDDVAVIEFAKLLEQLSKFILRKSFIDIANVQTRL